MNLENLSVLCHNLGFWLIIASFFCIVAHVFVQSARNKDVLEKRTLLFMLGLNFAAMSFAAVGWENVVNSFVKGNKLAVASLISNIALSVLTLVTLIWTLVDRIKNRKRSETPIVILKKIAHKVIQRHSYYKKLMNDTSIPPITVGQIRKVYAACDSLTIYKYLNGEEYLIKSKANCKIDNQYDDYIVIKITSSINSSSIALWVREPSCEKNIKEK